MREGVDLLDYIKLYEAAIFYGCDELKHAVAVKFADVAPMRWNDKNFPSVMAHGYNLPKAKKSGLSLREGLQVAVSDNLSTLVDSSDFLQALNKIPEFASALLVQKVKASATAGSNRRNRTEVIRLVCSKCAAWISDDCWHRLRQVYPNAQGRATIWEMRCPNCKARVKSNDFVSHDQLKTVLL